MIENRFSEKILFLLKKNGNLLEHIGNKFARKFLRSLKHRGAVNVAQGDFLASPEPDPAELFTDILVDA